MMLRLRLKKQEYHFYKYFELKDGYVCTKQHSRLFMYKKSQDLGCYRTVLSTFWIVTSQLSEDIMLKMGISKKGITNEDNVEDHYFHKLPVFNEVLIMTYNIKLNAKDVKFFVDAASKCDFHIDVYTNNHNAVDAKSILGVLGLDLTRTLTVAAHGYDAEFDKFVKGYAVAC